jgi:hypothetical protein
VAVSQRKFVSALIAIILASAITPGGSASGERVELRREHEFGSHYPGYSVGSAQVLRRAFRSSADATPIVFVLDEGAAARESLKRLIRREGWRCATFALAQEFVTCRPIGAPNCLVLDASLHGTSALELQKRIAAERTGTSIIFVAGGLT